MATMTQTPTPSAQLRSRLFAERDSLRARMKALTSGIQVEQTADSMDATVALANRDQAAGELKRLRKTAADVECAIARWNLGAYGVCCDCDGPISPRRLEAAPEVSNCIRCAEKAERRGE